MSASTAEAEPEAAVEVEAAPSPHPRSRDRDTLALLALTAAGGAVYFGSSCDLSALHPVRQADSSLVYGANDALIGVLPAVENGRP